MSDERTPSDSPPEEPTTEWQPTAPAPPGWPAPPESDAMPPGMPPVSGEGPPQWPAPPPSEQQPAGPGGVHPLTIGRAFSVGWSLFRFRWKALIGVSLLLMVPIYLVQTAATIYATGAIDRWSAAAQEIWLDAFSEGRQPTLAELPPLPVEALIASLGAAIIVSIGGVALSAALIHITGWTYGGGHPTVGSALRATARRLPGLFGAALVVALTVFLVVLGGVVLAIGIVVAAGFEPGPVVLLAFIVGVATFAAVLFLGVRWTLYVQAMMLEGAGALASLGRSWRLASGSSWRVLGYLLMLLLVLMLVGIVAGILTLVFFGFNVDFETGRQLPYTPVQIAGQTLLGGLATLLVMPLYSAVMTLLYYDLRWRRGEAIGPPPA